ncbi:MAG: hypothetical protein BGO67_02015 [Alphaproteobacteria bacterium 41-28]|nr:MAG: hypothetical protein BGO67_02015 [Alphaproteobacteria bacterium 41-28]
MENDKRASADILKDLESIYAMAMASENFSVALKAKELLGRQMGLFIPKQKNQVSLSDLSEEDLERLIREIKTELTLDQGETGE